jgi:hypothetical protein
MSAKNLKYFLYSTIFHISTTGCFNSNQIAKIDYSFSGDFGSEQSELLIYKKDSFIMAKLKTEGKKEQEVKLNFL